RAVELNPNLGLAFDLRGNARQEKGRLEAAIADYDHAIKLDPMLMTAYFHRGVARYNRGDWDGAVADFTQAYELYSRPDASRGRITLQVDQMVFTGAAGDRLEAITSSLARAHAQRGMAKLRQGKEAESEQDFARALELDKELKTWLEPNINEVKRQLVAG